MTVYSLVGDPSLEQVADAELAEAEFMFAFESGAPETVREQLGTTTVRLHGGVALAMRHDPTGGYWNKALGFGVTEPVADEVIGDVLDVYRENGSGVAVLQIAPAVLPADWDDLCARHGIVSDSTWTKLLRAPTPPSPARSDLRVGPVEAGDLDAWAEVMRVGFEMPEGPLTGMFAGSVRSNPAFQAFGAWDGDRLVSGGLLHVKDGRAAFCGVATLPEARNRGAQSALFVVRVEAARAAGARVFSAETWRPGDGQVNPSLNNMLRAGFQPVYDRTNWVWRARSSD
ncbi:MAG TPA: GNAT family N-acetyltransferase [Propionibacteriaceae bacterium]|nr:GNAT family N-acetyltransferase [Propionibacteriaceae bacterium]